LMGIPCQTRWNPLKKWFVFEKKKSLISGLDSKTRFLEKRRR